MLALCWSGRVASVGVNEMESGLAVSPLADLEVISVLENTLYSFFIDSIGLLIWYGIFLWKFHFWNLVPAVQCPYLDDPTNGRVSLSGSTAGATATYTCNQGFILLGNEMRICQSNGEWEGVAPICTREPYK